MIYIFDKINLSYKKVTNKVLIISFLGIFCVSFIVINYLKEVKFITAETRAIILKEQNEFSKAKLKAYLVELNIRFPHIVMAQAEMETGHFTSTIFKENRNLFGMKQATKRPTTNKGEQYNHAYYDNWKASVVDYAFFQAAYLSDIKTEKQYLEYLQQNYAEDTTYVPKLLQIINSK